MSRYPWSIFLALIALNMVYNTSLPLLGDEAYYWAWSRQLDWSYFDHPPMIAWMIKAATLLGEQLGDPRHEDHVRARQQRESEGVGVLLDHGLDDLFGMGATGDNTRIRMPKAEPEGEAARPRRPVVTSPEELARLGLDRRPPAAPAPAATREPGKR